MTEMITNITDHNRAIRDAEASARTWLEIEKYANVIRPVKAIPTDRMRAPRPYARSCPPPAVDRRAAPSAPSPEVAERGLEADKQHGPGEGRAYLDHFPVAREQRDERPLGPVVEMLGGVAESRPVRATGDVEHAPQRLAGNRDEQVPLGAARHLGQRVVS